MTPLEKCLDIVEELGVYQEAVADARRVLDRTKGVLTFETRAELDKAQADQMTSLYRLRSLPRPTPEQLAELRERGK